MISTLYRVEYDNKDRLMKLLSLLLLMTLLCWFSTGCTITNKYGPYYGKVVDKETKEPIEGAAVLIVFYKSTASVGGAVYHYADAIETVTDKNGEFRLEAHRIVSPGILQWWDKHENVTIFKPGYGCYPTHPDVQALEPGFPNNVFVTIELPRLRTKEERIVSTHCSSSSDVPYKKARLLIDLINSENVALGLEPERQR